MVLRTALNRRRFEIEDLRENLNQHPLSHLATSDYPAAAAMVNRQVTTKTASAALGMMWLTSKMFSGHR